ncbi:restriction endonuclease subunit S [Fusobacterium massiliense]|uniref:restriction endonuclease subunit S n=1 Tax=Fusobacterium massiliense TaxID=1852365 RepID=UPI00093E2582|nr:restriction endonuclease subunit S [Fusobacterium massiliense]
MRSKQQAQNLIKILQYVYGYVELELDKVANITMGVSPNGNSITDTKNEENIEFHQGKTYFGETMLLQSNVYTNEPKKYAEKNSIVMSVRAPVGDTNMTDRKIAIGRGLCSILADEEISTTKYLYYYIQSNVDKLKAMSNGSTFEAINSENIRKFAIPLPPLEEQQRIVDILDRFDKLCNDISEGLPAEIEARQKQYEYYREKLLTLKKL